MHRLLLVDDEVNVLSAIKRSLRAGFDPKTLHVEAISNPRIALDRAEEVGFDLVVSDFRMPVMDGVQFLQQFRKLHPHAVRIMLTASAEVQTLLRAVNDVGVQRYIVKPWQDADLINQIREGLKSVDQVREEQRLADESRQQRGQITPAEAERRRLQALNPELMQVQWGPNGEVLMPDLLDPDTRPAPF